MPPIVVALGGNALEPGERSLDFPQLAPACEAMAEFAEQGLLVTHGNGPQIGLLANALGDDLQQPLDVLGAETEGWLGYAIEQELGNRLLPNGSLATILTRVLVSHDDAAFNEPQKPIGPWLNARQADGLRDSHDWQFLQKDNRFRRLVPSPRPIEVLQMQAIAVLLKQGVTVICAGGGGIPVIRSADNTRQGVEAVVDKDFTSSLLASQLEAKMLVLATNVDGVYKNWDSENRQRIHSAQPEELLAMDLPAGSMGPKVEAACEFVDQTGNPAIIGAIEDLAQLLVGKGGTLISHESVESGGGPHV